MGELSSSFLTPFFSYPYSSSYGNLSINSFIWPAQFDQLGPTVLHTARPNPSSFIILVASVSFAISLTLIFFYTPGS